MQWKSYFVQNSNSTVQVICHDSKMALDKAKSMNLKGPFVVRERGIATLIEIDGKVMERGKLTEKILSDSFPNQTKEWLRRTFESFGH